MNYWIAGTRDGKPALDGRGRPQIIGALTRTSQCLCPAPAGTGNLDGEIVRLLRVYDDPNTGKVVTLAKDEQPPRIEHKPLGAPKALAVVPLVRWAAEVDEAARKRRDEMRAAAVQRAEEQAQATAYRQARKMEYAIRLGGDEQSATLIDTLGDVVDVLIKRVREIETAGLELPENKEWSELIATIDAIKTEHPKT